MSEATGVLLMAYGTPEHTGQVADYYTHIRGGRRPSDDAIARLVRRYERVGGATPLLGITRALESPLARSLVQATGRPWRVYTGMKHWHPFVADTLARIVAEGLRRVVAVALAPHYSRPSIGGYRRAIESARHALGAPLEIVMVESWHLVPAFVSLVAERVRSAHAALPGDPAEGALTIFTAHSLPARIREWDDPYERQLLASSAAVAAQAQVGDWRFAWQSAGETGEPWLGPDILELLETLAGSGVRRVVQCPIGFVSDHLEILYDIDVEAAERAAALGLCFRRTALPNATPEFVAVLASVVEAAERGGVGVSVVRLPSQ